MMTNSIANAVIAHRFGGSALAQRTAWWLALFTTAPGADGADGVEVSDSGYSRINVTGWTLDTANRAAKNTAIVKFWNSSR